MNHLRNRLFGGGFGLSVLLLCSLGLSACSSTGQRGSPGVLPTPLQPAASATDSSDTSPGGSLVVVNQTMEVVRVRVDGHLPLEIPGGQSGTVDGLPEGEVSVEIRLTATGRVSTYTVTSSSKAPAQILLAREEGSLVVENHLDEAFAVRMGDLEVGRVEPGGALLVDHVATGRVTLRATGDSGRVRQQDFVVLAGSSQTWLLVASNSQLNVSNLVGESIDLYVDGQRLHSLGAGNAVRLSVTPGRRELAVYCPTTGYTQKQWVDVAPGTLLNLPVGPQSGRLRVDNQSTSRTRVYRNAHPLGVVLPGSSAEFAGQPLGTSLIEVVAENGFVHRQSVVMEGDREHPALVVLSGEARPLMVRNDTGEPVRVGPDMVESGEILASGEEKMLHFVQDSGIARFLGEESRRRYDIELPASDASQPLVIGRNDGGILVENATDSPMTLWVDGVTKGTIGSGERSVLPLVPPGRHVLEARREDGWSRSISCELTQSSWFTWHVAPAPGSLRVINHSGEAMVLHWGTTVVGHLPPDGNTVLGGLPLTAQTFLAVGIESRSAFRFSFTPEGLEIPTWVIAPVLGGVRLESLWRDGGTVTIDDGSTLEFSASGEPYQPSIPLESGSHRLTVKKGNGETLLTEVSIEGGTETTVDVSGTPPVVLCRNDTSSTLRVMAHDHPVGEVAPGQVLEISCQANEDPDLRVEMESGGREWRLRGVLLPPGKRLGWTLSE